jgi:hypothetical protein
MTKIYLRERIVKSRYGEKSTLDIFSGNIEDIKKDKAYSKKSQNTDTRYFIIKEVKVRDKK